MVRVSKKRLDTAALMPILFFHCILIFFCAASSDDVLTSLIYLRLPDGIGKLTRCVA